MKKILFCICAVAMTSWFSACKDDDGDKKVANEFTLDNNKHSLTGAYADSVETQVVGDKTYHYWDVVVVSSGITYDNSSESFKGTGDAVRFDLYTTASGVVPEGTYTAAGADSGIEAAMIFLGINTEAGGGTIYDNEITDGQVKVTKSGSSHVFDFSFTLNDNRVIKGTFKGNVSEIPSF